MSVTPDEALPCVVIVGRPNVGKSSLFNRLLRRRIAIVDAQPGVTRDRLSGTVCRGDRCWTLVDTGGVEDAGSGAKTCATGAGIRRQVETALAGAHLALLVVDAQGGLTGPDASLAGDLRRRGVAVLVVVNKCDNDGAAMGAAEFSRLGFAWIPVSAAHGRGIDELLDRIEALLPERNGEPVSHATAPDMPVRRLAVVGRPNVGKSSLINAFLRTERMLVSDVPGTTRDAVDVALAIGGAGMLRSFVVTDTAGLRRPRELQSAVEAFSIRQAERTVRDCDIAALVIEAGRAPTAQDKKIAALIRDHRRAALVLANKTDLVEDSALDACRREIFGRLPFMAFCPVVFVSARRGRNIRVALSQIGRMGERIDVRIATGPLNRALERGTKRVQPPIVRGGRANILYAVQTGNNPLRIALFVNDPKRIPQSYRQFLEHEIRRGFPAQTEGLPIVFEFKARRGRPDAGV